MAVGDIEFEISAGRAGAVNKTAPYRIEGLICDEDMEAGLAVASGAVQGSVKLPASAGDVAKVQGVTVYAPYRFAFGAGGEEYAAKQVADVLNAGEIWVQVEEAVTYDNPCFVRHTADAALTTLGVFADGAGVGLAALPGAVFKSSTSGAGVARVRLNLPA